MAEQQLDAHGRSDDRDCSDIPYASLSKYGTFRYCTVKHATISGTDNLITINVLCVSHDPVFRCFNMVLAWSVGH